MIDIVKNFAEATITAIDASVTSVAVQTGRGARFSAGSAVLYNATDYASPSDDPNVEIVRVTGISTDTLTITRAQEGTSAATHNLASKTHKIVQGFTVRTLAGMDRTIGVIGTAVGSAGAAPTGTNATISDMSFGTVTIPAGTLAAGDRVVMEGNYQRVTNANSTAMRTSARFGALVGNTILGNANDSYIFTRYVIDILGPTSQVSMYSILSAGSLVFGAGNFPAGTVDITAAVVCDFRGFTNNADLMALVRGSVRVERGS